MKQNCVSSNHRQNNYDCIICLDLCKKPISCSRCKQLLCHTHLRLLGNKCPHCRLEPFQFNTEEMIESFIDIQIRKKRQQMKKNNVFKCLVEGCEFEAKYPNMVFHRKSKHSGQKLEQIIFPEERQKKKMRQALKRLFFHQYADKLNKYMEQAKLVYVKIKGAVELKHLTTMIAHIDNCHHQNCKQVILGQREVLIGRIDGEVMRKSTCEKGVNLKVEF